MSDRKPVFALDENGALRQYGYTIDPRGRDAMSETPKPALTPEEWASFPSWPSAEPLADDNDLPLYYPSKHGIAAANLYGTPEGFTREDVEAVRRARTGYELGWSDYEVHIATLASLADRIAALLPPEDKP